MSLGPHSNCTAFILALPPPENTLLALSLYFLQTYYARASLDNIWRSLLLALLRGAE